MSSRTRARLHNTATRQPLPPTAHRPHQWGDTMSVTDLLTRGSGSPTASVTAEGSVPGFARSLPAVPVAADTTWTMSGDTKTSAKLGHPTISLATTAASANLSKPQPHAAYAQQDPWALGERLLMLVCYTRFDDS